MAGDSAVPGKDRDPDVFFGMQSTGTGVELVVLEQSVFRHCSQMFPVFLYLLHTPEGPHHLDRHAGSAAFTNSITLILASLRKNSRAVAPGNAANAPSTANSTLQYRNPRDHINRAFS